MARSSVVQPLNDGGLGVVEVSCKVSSLRTVWLRHRYFSDQVQHPWKVFFDFQVSLVFPSQDAASLLARDTIPACRIKWLPPF